MKQVLGGLRIGRVAKDSNTAIETIRFYERSGLISEPPRRESGYREYPGEVIARLRFIKRAKELGFSLKEISDLLALSRKGEKNCATVRRRAQEKVSQIKVKIADLKRIESALIQLGSTCETRKNSDGCPILERFYDES
jgi:Hg(II)-responsive transcriptional regulator